jgi:hypothetical protein
VLSSLRRSRWTPVVLVVLLGALLVFEALQLDLGTPGFEAKFREAMGPDFATRIASNKTVSSGRVVAGPRAQSIAGGLATFLVVVDQQVTSEGGQEQPQVIRVGLLVSVDQKGGKVTKVEVL